MITRIAIVVAGILVVLVGRGLFFYNGVYAPPASEAPTYEQIIVVPTLPSTGFSDNYTRVEGTVLIDLAHDNDFEVEELNVLSLRLISRGLTIDFLGEKGDLEKRLLGKEKEPKKEKEIEKEEPEKEKEIEKEEPKKEEELEKEEAEKGEDLKDELPLADVFIVVCPQVEFSSEERETIGKFVNKGGKLLLIADPTRPSQINSLSLRFGLMFESDYLYNMKENDVNFRNIFISEFKENEITKNVEKIALYTVGSITSDNASIALVDENTFSSLIETRRKLSPVALADDGKVLAVHDFTFITEPYNGFLDNNRLISNIADWLASPAEEEEEEAEKEAPESEPSSSP